MARYGQLVMERRAAGLCTACGQPKNKHRLQMWRCAACAEKYRRTHPSREREKHYGEVRRLSELQIQVERIMCLRCNDFFTTPNRRTVRHCDRCRTWIETTATMTNSDWTEFDID